jgi:hypothetical protein
VTGHTVSTCPWRTGITLVVTGFTLGLRVAGREAQTRVISTDVGDFGPVGLVMTKGALFSAKPAFVGVLVTRHAIGLQTEKCGVATTVGSIVTVFAADRGVGPLKRPAGQPMIKARLRSARPTDELGISSQMLDMTPSALLPSVLVTVKPGALTNAHRQVIVAA